MGFYKSLRVANIITNLLNKKIGKIILFVVLCGVLFLLFSNGVLAVDNTIDLTVVNNVGKSGSTISTGSSNLAYFVTSGDYAYTIKSNFTSAHEILITTDIPGVGVSFEKLVDLEPGQSYTFVGNSNYYFTFFGSDSLNNRLEVTRRPIRGSDGAVADLVDQLSLSNSWGQLAKVVPFIGLAVLFALGFMVVRKLTKGEAKAKVKF